MRPLRDSLCGLLLASSLAGAASAEEVLHLNATPGREWVAPEADQGVAVDTESLYAIDNAVIARYPRAGGPRTGLWNGRDSALIHLNSCKTIGDKLWCAHSNYPAVPMASSVEVFDRRTLQPLDSHSLGHRDEGSLVWLDVLGSGWLAGFAHYDGKGGEPGRSQRYSGVVSFDDQWRRTGGWSFPDTVLERMAPHAASGGAIGPDSWLYVMGHDRPEMYVLGRPRQGSTLVHLATIALPAEGQAFSWAPDSRSVFVVLRRHGRIRQIDIPSMPPALGERALPFSESAPR